ncbi:MAG: hypothetical protein KJ718_00285 [Nanoarchaeota archaeon]|nr:hypothetical protein [Nanoarchaeota archaeon]MBU1050978.1 hypothetical protein [Nanoarchaeota archaeon]MBU1988022.1 hypothetical protein [Nanoarchaeota archaeon]
MRGPYFGRDGLRRIISNGEGKRDERHSVRGRTYSVLFRDSQLPLTLDNNNSKGFSVVRSYSEPGVDVLEVCVSGGIFGID